MTSRDEEVRDIAQRISALMSDANAHGPEGLVRVMKAACQQHDGDSRRMAGRLLSVVDDLITEELWSGRFRWMALAESLSGESTFRYDHATGYWAQSLPAYPGVCMTVGSSARSLVVIVDGVWAGWRASGLTEKPCLSLYRVNAPGDWKTWCQQLVATRGRESDFGTLPSLHYDPRLERLCRIRSAPGRPEALTVYQSVGGFLGEADFAVRALDYWSCRANAGGMDINEVRLEARAEETD